jgi:hypothetical protein
MTPLAGPSGDLFLAAVIADVKRALRRLRGRRRDA